MWFLNQNFMQNNHKIPSEILNQSLSDSMWLSTLTNLLQYNNTVWSRLLIHPRGVEGAHDFLGNSANKDSIRHAKREPGQAPVPTPTLETNKHNNTLELFLVLTLFLTLLFRRCFFDAVIDTFRIELEDLGFCFMKWLDIYYQITHNLESN
jgi:hypothetical protein